MRVLEGLRPRVTDIDFERHEIVVRDGKGSKDRVTILPESLVAALQAHLRNVRELHEEDVRRGLGRAELPHALARKYRRADREWCWQYVFPASSHYIDEQTESATATTFTSP